MNNAEWMIKQGNEFTRLHFYESALNNNYQIYLDDTCVAVINKGDICHHPILSWLDMEHEETEAKHNDVKHAHWIDMRLDDVHVCSHCDEVVVFSNGNDLIYCPYCGARMDGKDNE